MSRLDFTHDALSGRVVFGAGAARRALVDEVDRLSGTRVLLIASSSAREAAGAATEALGDRLVAVFDDVRPHVPIDVAESARAAAADAHADLIVSIGGGSAVGTAKAVALTHEVAIVAVPTTYAGSEVTPVWGLTEAGRKRTGVDRRVLPATVVYDPELTRSMPVGLSVVSGLNALAHSVEAFWAPGANPVTDVLAERSIAALATGLRGVVADPDDIETRGETLMGAWLAGAAFAVTGSALHHKICHALGGAYGLPHADTHAIVLSHVLALNAPHVPDAATRIAQALGADDAVTGVVDLARDLGAPTALRDIGFAEADLDEAVHLVADIVPPDNPAPAGRDQIATLIRNAWAGTTPG